MSDSHIDQPTQSTHKPFFRLPREFVQMSARVVAV